jgi:hypothetical protein
VNVTIDTPQIDVESGISGALPKCFGQARLHAWPRLSIIAIAVGARSTWLPSFKWSCTVSCAIGVWDNAPVDLDIIDIDRRAVALNYSAS